MRDAELVFTALGGVGEIGMNLALYGYGARNDKTWIAVDMGQAFTRGDLPGIDAILPDISYLVERKQKLAGILITHAHEDHFGALFDHWPRLGARIFATPFAAGLLEAKRASEPNAPKLPVTVVEQGARLSLGPFEAEYVAVSHSVPEPNALAIRTPLGTVLHTGDWKIDPTPLTGRPLDHQRLEEIGRDGLLALVGDSTNAVRDGISPSEAEVAAVLKTLIADAPYRVAVTLFASNVARLRSVAEAARDAGRECVVVGRALHRSIGVARELGYLDGIPEFRDQDAFMSLPRNKVVALMTGSQGEPRAALARIAEGDHRMVSLAPGDRVVFSSRTIPGNEGEVNAIINALVDLGAEIVTDRDALVHVSGHPRRDELRRMLEWTRPRILVPVHGEALHLSRHAALAREAGVPEVVEVRNGDLLRLAPGAPEVIGRSQAGRVYRDGRLLVAPDASGVAERRRLAFAGAVTLSVTLSDAGEVIEDPRAALHGLPKATGDGVPFSDLVEEVADEALEQMPKKKRRDAEAVAETVRRAVRAAVEAAWGKKTQVAVLVTHVED